MKLSIDGKSYEVELQPDAVVVGGVTYKTSVLHDNGEATVRVAGRPYKVKIKDEKTVIVDGRQFTVEMSGRASVARKAPKPVKVAVNGSEKGAVLAPMPGKVLSLRVKEGERVASGAVLLILEAMKMMNEIKAPSEGVVKRISVAAGQTVSNGDVLAVIE
jgi:glutaconyl-CoA/methylmalonyl-CoA decarboxylase subunit gamma